MLIEATKRKDLDFRALMEVYQEGNEENGAVLYPDQPPERRIGLAEENFDRYLTETFFPTPGARYLIWAEDGRYVSALRLERYEDGMSREAYEDVAEAISVDLMKRLEDVCDGYYMMTPFNRAALIKRIILQAKKELR